MNQNWKQNFGDKFKNSQNEVNKKHAISHFFQKKNQEDPAPFKNFYQNQKTQDEEQHNKNENINQKYAQHSDNQDKDFLKSFDLIHKLPQVVEKQKEIKLDPIKVKEQIKLSVDVYFPKQPYDVQIKYMEAVIKALNLKQNALLESPTGTGKTLCALCSTLSWLKRERQVHQNLNVPSCKIIYLSRTHSQLKQVIRELNTTVYKPMSTILASRDKFCIKKEFVNFTGSMLNNMCMKARKVFQVQMHQEIEGESCKYVRGLYKTLEKYPQTLLEKAMDIEQLQDEGRINTFCPFYYSIKIAEIADIIFMPYNYLLEQRIQSKMNLQLGKKYEQIILKKIPKQSETQIIKHNSAEKQLDNAIINFLIKSYVDNNKFSCIILR